MGRFTKEEKEAFAERMRRNPTGSEALLFDRLRPYGFLAQQNVLGWIVDLLHPQWKIVVEVDGSSHDARIQEDASRDWAMSRAGYLIWRVRADRVIEDVDRVATAMLDVATDPFDEILSWWFCYDGAFSHGMIGNLERGRRGLPVGGLPIAVTQEEAIAIANRDNP